MKRTLLRIAVPALALAAVVAVAAAARAPAPRAFNLVKMQMFSATNIDATLGGVAMAQLPTPVFTYTKVSATSMLKITYQDPVANRGPSASTCVYQVRVDGNVGMPGNPWSPPILIVSNVVNTSLSSAGVFRGLAAGNHRITIWHRQANATQCIRNSGGFVTTVLVEEFET